jgi:hypothetical protein
VLTLRPGASRRLIYLAAVKRVGLLATIVLLAVVPFAWADGDPASDVLLAQDAYYTYAPPVSARLTSELNDLLKRARSVGYPMKVALIETVGDLGAYPRLFGDAKEYAELLASEISFNISPHLIVVMPSGLAGRNLGSKADELLARIKVDRAARSNGLAKAALFGVARVATANGHPLPVPELASAELAPSERRAKRSPPSLLVYGGPVLLAAIAVGLLLLASRRREASRDVGP